MSRQELELELLSEEDDYETCPVGYCQNGAAHWLVKGYESGYISACLVHAKRVAQDAIDFGELKLDPEEPFL